MTKSDVQLRIDRSRKAAIVEGLSFAAGLGTMILNLVLMLSYDPDPQIWLMCVGGLIVIVGIIAFRARLRQWDEIADDLRTSTWEPDALILMRSFILYAPQNARIRILEAQFDKSIPDSK